MSVGQHIREMLALGIPYDPLGYPVNKWKAAKTQARARKRHAKLVMLGDSTTGGFGAGTTVGLSYNDNAYRSNCGSQLAIAIDSKVQSATRDAIFGTSNCVAGGSGVTYVQFDPRVTIGTGWATSDGSTLLGGGFFQATTTTVGKLDFQPENPFDSFTVYYPTATTGTTNLVVQVDDSAVGYAAISNNSGANGIGSATYTIAGQLAAHKISFTSPNAAVNAWVTGIICWHSRNPGVVVCVAGVAGGTAAQLSNDTAFNSLQMLALVAPDLTILNLTINDQNGQPAAATYVSNINIIVDKALLTGDVIMLVNSPNTNAGFTNGYLTTVTPLLKAACITRSVNMIDLRDYLGYTWAVANTAGYMDSTTGVHPNAVGASVIMDSFFKYI